MLHRIALTALLSLVAILVPSLRAQDAPQRPAPPPEFQSPEVSADRKITFRVHAPKAAEVRLASSDLPDAQRGFEMKKSDEGVWEVSVGPVPAGAYRYNFNVDGLAVIDPRNPSTSEANSNTWSLAVVPGSDLSDTNDVPHGAVAAITYHSKSLGRPRRAHVYTPPGYEKGTDSYPVFYLLHGAFDCDNAWSTVGRAGFILDNLIAAGKAKPMIVVMPMGHTGPFRFGGRGGNSFERQMDEFVEDFTKDLRPHIEARYRTIDDRAHRAIAGLSMGGAQTLSIAFPNLGDYGYIGVYSSGIFGIAGSGPNNAQPDRRWEDRNQKNLDDAELKNGLKLLWFATGKDDFLVRTTEATVDMLKSHGFDVVYRETEGGHTWLNWRDYLGEFAPMLFQ